MDIITIISFFRLDKFDKEIYNNEIYHENIRRTLYLTLIAIPVSTIHVIRFFLKLHTTNPIEQQWVMLIISYHTIIVVASAISSFLIYFYFYRKKQNNFIGRFLVQMILVLLLLGGSALASADQLMMPAITPYLVTSFIVGLIFLIPPLYATIYYIGAYIIFVYAISFTQSNPDVLISNQVNGLSITAIGLILSFILWRANLTRIKQSRQIVTQNKVLSDMNLEKDKFLTIIAHDLKSPFNAVLGFSEILEEKLKDKDYEEIEKYIGIISRSSQLAMDLLSNLMEWSKSQTGRMNFNPLLINLEEIIQNNILFFSDVAERKSINIIKKINHKDKIFADKHMINTVLRNLISNAIKFVKLDGEIIIATEQTPENIIVSVSVNGVGIPTFRIKNIFNIGESFSTSGTSNEKGTGLGLILCKEFVDKHSGNIWVESEEGKGSVFYFTLPFKK